MSRDKIIALARVLYEEEDNYQQALDMLLPLANSGDGEAMGMVGNVYNYYNWDGFDMDQSIKWWKRGAAMGDPKSLYRMGNEYHDGDYVEQDDAKSAEMYRKAAEAGHVEAMFEYAYICFDDESPFANVPEAIRWFREASEAGNEDAEDFMRHYYLYADCEFESALDIDSEAVLKFHSLSKWHSKDTSGLCDLGAEMVNKYISTQDLAYRYAALRCYRLAVERGFKPAMTLLANAIMKCNLSDYYSEAAKLYRKRAEDGYVYDMYVLAVDYKSRLNVTDNEAVKWLRRGAEAGSLCCMYKITESTRIDASERIKWYRKLADNGIFEAASAISQIYMQGDGVSKDLAESKKWWSRALKCKTKIESVFAQKGKDLDRREESKADADNRLDDIWKELMKL